MPTLASAAVSDRVRGAATATYFHGMTREIAEQEAGPQAVPELLELLRDPAFPRRDNVVAFLAYLGGAESTTPLERLLDDPPAPLATPEETRARILVPHALGRIAGRGVPQALDLLLHLTKGSGPLREEAVASLAYVDVPAARKRLAAIARDPADAALAATARRAIGLMAELGKAPAVPAVTYTPDPSTVSHQHGISFANHAAVAEPHDDGAPRIHPRGGDAARGARGLRRGRAVLHRGRALGVGRNVRLRRRRARHHRLGGGALQRLQLQRRPRPCRQRDQLLRGSRDQHHRLWLHPRERDRSRAPLGAQHEAVLWIHEYGHNLGLDHASDNRDLMYPTDNGNNNGLTTDECQAFHNPASGSAALLTNIGACTDDGDTWANPIDNCPFTPNDGQQDSNGNGIGDACEACPSGDSDGDGICNNVDDCPSVADPSQPDIDDDGFGDACETGARLADIDLSGLVTGPTSPRSAARSDRRRGRLATIRGSISTGTGTWTVPTCRCSRPAFGQNP
jgi:hypothetical protein